MVNYAITSIRDAQIRQLASKYDNGDGYLSREEMQRVASDELANLLSSTGRAEMQTMVDSFDESSWFSKWLDDKDKISTDGNDDGKISFTEGLKSFGKGFIGLVKGAVNHPLITAGAIAGGIGLTVATGGAALPVMIALGTTLGAGMIGYGGYKAATAKTDGEAKAAWESIGSGTFAVAASVAGAKTSLIEAEKAGVTAAQGADSMGAGQALLQNFKAIPEAIRVSGLNIKGNVLTWATGNIHAHSNALRGAEKFMSKANDVQAYRFNPNGTEEEILANNPGVFRGQDGNYYLPNKWNPSEPYLIDPTKEQMIMMYDGMNDMAVCDGKIFNNSYVQQAAFRADGTKTYIDPSKLEYGQVIDATKQAPGAFKVLPEGTKIQTLEGTRTVQQGEVVAIDLEGNPYATPASAIVKRNTGFSVQGQTQLDNILNAQIIQDVKSNAATLIKDPKNVPLVQSRADKYSDLVVQLKNAKLPNGNPRFTNDDICTILLNVEESELSNPDLIFSTLSQCDKYGLGGAFGLWKCLYN